MDKTVSGDTLNRVRGFQSVPRTKDRQVAEPGIPSSISRVLESREHLTKKVAGDFPNHTFVFVDPTPLIESAIQSDPAIFENYLEKAGLSEIRDSFGDLCETPDLSALLRPRTISFNGSSFAILGACPEIPPLEERAESTQMFAEDDPLAWRFPLDVESCLDQDAHQVGHALNSALDGKTPDGKDGFEAYRDECMADSFAVYMATIRDRDGRNAARDVIRRGLSRCFDQGTAAAWTGDIASKARSKGLSDFAKGVTSETVSPLAAMKTCRMLFERFGMTEKAFGEFREALAGGGPAPTPEVGERLEKARSNYAKYVTAPQGKGEGIPLQDWQRKMMRANPERSRAILYGASLLLARRVLSGFAAEAPGIETRDLPYESIARLRIAARICRFVSTEELAFQRNNGGVRMEDRQSLAKVAAIAEALGNNSPTFSSRRPGAGGMQKAERCVARLASEVDHPALGAIFKSAARNISQVARMFAEPPPRAASSERER